jgi:hypothetical protein
LRFARSTQKLVHKNVQNGPAQDLYKRHCWIFWASETITFSIANETEPQPEPFPTTLIKAPIA